MKTPPTPEPNRELARLEVLRFYKEHLIRQEEVNLSPFTENLVVRYDSRVEDYDVPDIHCAVRERVVQTLQDIHAGKNSQVVILAGNPGIGKSHLINHSRDPRQAEKLGYILVCNSNHWKSNEFEACLLDWIISALAPSAPDRPDLLLKKIEDVAFEALEQILSQPGQVRHFEKGRSYWGRLWRKVWPNHERFQRLVATRDRRVFKELHFARFAKAVCERFLHDPGNPFHCYALHVLLRYLFEDDRDRVIHWLRRREVDFSDTASAKDYIDANYKVIDTIKVLISLFTREVSRNLGVQDGADRRGIVFFFAFDQMEGRAELFEKDEEWMKFFAQLSELYNTLPNVFILFTMTLALRQRLFPTMERQFKDRISRDPIFYLHTVPDDEILSLYRKRVDRWLGEKLSVISGQLSNVNEPYLPFTQEEVLGLSRAKTLRETLDALDEEFSDRLRRLVTQPRIDYLAFRNALRPREEDAKQYTEDHVQQVKKLFDRAGEVIVSSIGVTFGHTEWRDAATGQRLLWVEFRDAKEPTQWVRVLLARLPFGYNQAADACIEQLKNKQISRNFLWMVRLERVNSDLENKKKGQVFVRPLSPSCHTTVQALLQLWENKDQYGEEEQSAVDAILRDEIKETYLGELLQQVRGALANLQGVAPDESEGELVRTMDEATPSGKD